MQTETPTVEIIKWPSATHGRHDWWIVHTWQDGTHSPLFGPYPTRKAAQARLDAYGRRD